MTAKDPILVRGGNTNLYGYTINDPVNFLDANGMLFGFNAGESYGARAAQYWANKAAQTGNPLYHVPGIFAATWTPCTSSNTTAALVGGGTIGSLLLKRLGTAAILGSIGTGGAVLEAWNEPSKVNIAKAMTALVASGTSKSVLDGGASLANRLGAAVIEASNVAASSAAD